MSYYPPAKVLIESNDPQSALESGRKATKDESGEKVGSTGGLQILLLQQCLRDNFRGFISSQWIPSENNSDFQYYPQTNPRKVALSCVDFLSDAQDFTSLRPSAFHEYRAYHIYEKYIVHGCMFPVPLSMNTKDDCTDALFCSKGELDPTLFAIAESEVLDFLAAEVYPMFERTNLAISLSGKDKNSGALSSATDSLAKLGTAINTRRKSLFKSPDRVALTTIMNKILADPTYLASFKTYMCSVGAENFLYAYNDAVELKERLQNLLRMDCSPSPRGDGDADRNEGLSCPNDEEKEEKSRTSTTPSQQALSIAITPRTSVQGSATAAWQVFFHYVNTFYDTYLSLGARFRLNIRTNTMNTFHLQLSQANGVDPNVVSSIEQCTFETLIRDHLDKFLNTSEYRHLVRKGRGSILVIAAGLQERLDIDPSRKADIEAAVRKQKTSVQTNSYFGGSADADDVDTGSDNQITEMGDSFATTASDSTAVGASASADANANASASRKLSKVPDLSSSLFSSANGYGNSNEADVVTRLELKNYVSTVCYPVHILQLRLIL